MVSSIVSLMQSKPDFYALQGATDSEIENAEHTLGTQFALGYRDYVSALGVASLAGHEFTGICKPKRLNGLNHRHNQLQNRVLSTGEQLFLKCQVLFFPALHGIMPLSVC